jgi:hypothetical protein
MTVATAANKLAKSLILLVGDPANREINREFRQIRPLCAILKADTRVNSKAYDKLPCATEQGIISTEQGILAQKQGILPA